MTDNTLHREVEDDGPTSPIDQPGAAITCQQALVIGIDAYPEGFRTLSNAVNDAQAIAVLLAQEYGFDLLPQGQALLNEAAGLKALQQAISGSLAAARADTRWLLYFAGHGKAIDGQGYLIPADAAKGQVDTYIFLSWLLDQCRASACAEALIILDACYSGSALVRPDELSDYLPSAGGPDRLIQIITSGNPDQPVLDGGGQNHSVFTQALLDALEGWVGVHEADGQVRFSSLLPFMKHGLADRLQAASASPWQQQTVGGNILSSRSGGDFTFQSRKARLSPNLVHQSRDGRTEQRLQAMNNLPKEAGEHPERRPAASELAAAHLRRSPQERSIIDPAAWQEPDAAVRAAAAQALGELKASETWPDLVAALDDQIPVAQAAAQALGKLGVIEAAKPLLEHLENAPDELFLYLADAIGAIGEQESILKTLRIALQKKKLVPFVGPDFPQSLTGVPDRAAFAQYLAQREGIQPVQSLAQVAARVTRDGAAWNTLISSMRDAFDDQIKPPDSIHQDLTKLDLPLWISAAYDGLLVKALKANQIIMGNDTQFWRPDRPTVVRLAGDAGSVRGMVVLEKDYQVLREDEGDRRLLLNFLRQELAGKVVLFLGFDPDSPDFELLVEHVLGQHLAGLEVRAFLAWEKSGETHRWGEYRLHPVVYQQPADLIESLSRPDRF